MDEALAFCQGLFLLSVVPNNGVLADPTSVPVREPPEQRPSAKEQPSANFFVKKDLFSLQNTKERGARHNDGLLFFSSAC
jgi:hypothetical protein